MVTRSDVARRAGTSPSLVSYVLNGGPRNVAPDTELRIRAAIEELGYRPNRLARLLRMSKTMTLGLIVPDSSNPYFAELSNAVEDAAFAAGYSLLIGNSAELGTREQIYLDAFEDHQVDGLILVPSIARTVLQESELPDVPIVLLDRTLRNCAAPVVSVDNFTASKLATEHLLGHGRTKVACIAGPASVGPTEDRVNGFNAAVEGQGNPVRADWIVRAEFGTRAGYDAVIGIFESTEARPDSLFVASDEQAIGALKALEHLGLGCPADVTVVAFDGISASAFTRPGITTMSQPFELLGKQSVEALLSAIGGQVASALPTLEAELTVRDSCGCGAGRVG